MALNHSALHRNCLYNNLIFNTSVIGNQWGKEDFYTYWCQGNGFVIKKQTSKQRTSVHV